MALQTLAQWEAYFAAQPNAALFACWLAWGRDRDDGGPEPTAAELNAWAAVNQEMRARGMD